jgi:biopolymer transport protein TolR
MAMSTGSNGKLRGDINVTPLVDVVLVLLIIFMIATPLLQLGYQAAIPPQVKPEPGPVPPPIGQLVLRMAADGSYFINSEKVAEGDFPRRLQDVLAGRGRGVTFLAASGDLPYERVMAFFDLCRRSGAGNLGVVLQELS